MKCKKILCICMAAVLVFPALPGITASAREIQMQEADAKAAGTTEDGYSYEERNDGTLAITGYSGSSTELVIPSEIDGKSVTRIAGEAFVDCESLTSVKIPDSVTDIGWAAFCNCSALTSIEIPDGVTSIEHWTFAGCESLASVKIPGSVTSIGWVAFSRCTSLRSIEIPSSVESIGDTAFTYCERLEMITVDKNNPFFTSEDGILYNKDKTTLLCCPGGKKNVNIPSGVTGIGSEAFWNCTYLTSVKLPGGVARIEAEAFIDCENLASITIPESMASIERRAFYHCKKLKNIYYGGSREQWEGIAVCWGDGENDYLRLATIHYNSDGPAEASDQTITAKNITKTYGAKPFSLNAKVNTGTALTYSVSDRKVATVDKKGKVTIKGCGITNITITAPATDAYNQAKKTIKLTVKPQKVTLSSVKSTKKKTATVKWKQDRKAAGYLIQCATDSKFKKNKVQVTVSKNKTVSATVKKLKPGKKYYVRVCAYARSGKTKVQGDWSRAKTVKVKK